MYRVRKRRGRVSSNLGTTRKEAERYKRGGADITYKKMRFTIFALFFLLAVVFGQGFDFNLGFSFAEEEDEEELAG